MNKKMFLVAILSVTLLTISLVAVAENVQKEIAPEEQNTVQPSNGKEPGGGQELSSPAFHETQFSSSNIVTLLPPSPVNVMTQFVFVPAGGAELTATFSAITDTNAAQTLQIRILDNGVCCLSPGIVTFDSISEEDGFQAHSFTWGKTLTPGVHNITVVASGGGVIGNARSLETEIEELP